MKKIYISCVFIVLVFAFLTLLFSKGAFLLTAVILMFAYPWLSIASVLLLKKLNVLNKNSLKIYSWMSGGSIFIMMMLTPIQLDEIKGSGVGVVIILFVLVLLASVVSAFATYYFSNEYMKRFRM